MKKPISLILCALILISALSFAPAAAGAASAGKLILTDEGRQLGEIEVGNEFIFKVGLYTGDRDLINGQGIVSYDPAYLAFVGYSADGSSDWDSYCFPQKIINTSLVTNYTAGGIYYNFSKYSGIEGFTNVKQHYFKARFRALKAGTADISHITEVMTARENDEAVRLYNRGKANEQIDPIPYSISSVEASSAYIGDANGDYDISVLDATYVQMITAGKKLDYKLINADVNNDGAVSLRDSLIILRYKAGIKVLGDIGEWIFDSEQ